MSSPTLNWISISAPSSFDVEVMFSMPDSVANASSTGA